MSYIRTPNDFYLEVERENVPNAKIIRRSGRNPNITSGSAPEDLWNGSAPYTGFPTSSPETLQFFSSSASDTGVLTYSYLATSASTVWTTTTVTLNGTSPVSGVSAYRCLPGIYQSGSAATFNVGTITCRHTTTTANVFFQLPIGRSRTYVCAYTVPAGSTAYLFHIEGAVNSTSNVNLEMAVWSRPLGGSPILDENFTISNSYDYIRNYKGGYKFVGGTDLTIRIISSTSNSGQIVTGGFALIEFKN